jgi:hypothetical protein
MTQKYCQNCRFWVQFGTGCEATVGTCHRRAPHKPTDVSIGACETTSVWPPTDFDDFCGQWKALTFEQIEERAEKARKP